MFCVQGAAWPAAGARVLRLRGAGDAGRAAQRGAAGRARAPARMLSAPARLPAHYRAGAAAAPRALL